MAVLHAVEEVDHKADDEPDSEPGQVSLGRPNIKKDAEVTAPAGATIKIAGARNGRGSPGSA